VRSAGAPGGEPGLSPPAHEHPHGVHSGRHLGWRAQLAEFIRFGMVGGVAFVVDVGLFNLLRFGPGELLEAKPVTAKIISAGVATLVAWLGNRHFAFARHRTDNPGRELVGFILVNIGGALIAGACLAVSHYALGLTSPLADNISANVVGLGLGTAFRYFAYKWLIFTGQPEPHPEAPADAEGTTHGSGRA
jgi:putative flippase GtrA